MSNIVNGKPLNPKELGEYDYSNLVDNNLVTRNKYKELCDEYKYHCELYYREAQPEIPDADFDRLEWLIKTIEINNFEFMDNGNTYTIRSRLVKF